jgi:hypothetical protein
VLVHALLPLAVILLIGLGAVVSGRVVAPYHFGQGLGRYAVFPMVTAAGASYMLQSGRRGLGAGAGGRGRGDARGPVRARGPAAARLSPVRRDMRTGAQTWR